MSIGENIRNIRKQNHLTQKKLGELCEPPISESTIRKYELGLLNPKIQTISKIAKALEVNSSQIINGFDSYNNNNFSNIYDPLEITDDPMTYLTNEQLSIFGNNIKKYRQQNHMSLKKLSTLSGISEENLKQYEAGLLEPNIYIVSQISKVFNIRNSSLLGDYGSLMTLSARQNLGDDANYIFIDGVNIGEENLLRLYRFLNREGQKVAIERLQELLFIPNYKKESKNNQNQ